jgi:hypothetical protein
MIQFKLDPKDFNYLNAEYDIAPINNQNVPQHYQLMQEAIGYFNSEVEWDEMFTFEEAVSRVQNGMVMYIGVIDTTVFGYVWFKEYINNRFLFNLFIRNNVADKTYTGKEFVSDVINRYEYGKVIHCEVDDWNEKSIKLFKKLGFKASW